LTLGVSRDVADAALRSESRKRARMTLFAKQTPSGAFRSGLRTRGCGACCLWGHPRRIEILHLDRMIHDLDEAADLSTANASP
jgi:hypothetical protein